MTIGAELSTGVFAGALSTGLGMPVGPTPSHATRFAMENVRSLPFQVSGRAACPR